MSALPIPPGEEHGALAERVRAAVRPDGYMAVGTALTHGGLWRYSMQLAPLTLMLVSAVGAILVTSVRDFRRREGSPA